MDGVFCLMVRYCVPESIDNLLDRIYLLRRLFIDAFRFLRQTFPAFSRETRIELVAILEVDGADFGDGDQSFR